MSTPLARYETYTKQRCELNRLRFARNTTLFASAVTAAFGAVHGMAEKKAPIEMVPFFDYESLWEEATALGFAGAAIA